MHHIKYQIFVSSTFTDLKEERDQIIKATLEMGHIPVGMEMFSAADEEQWKIITRQIDQSDYYVVIVAHRYGSVINGVSYTEMEYDYAVQHGIPVIGFVIEDHALWPADRIETDTRLKKPLDRFKSKVKRKPVGCWSSADELHGKFSIALMKQFITNPRPGWARASELPGLEVLAELSRLSSENAVLRERLENLSSQEAEYIGLSFDELCSELAASKIHLTEPIILGCVTDTASAFGDTEPHLLHFFWLLSDHFLRGEPLGKTEKQVGKELNKLVDFGLIRSETFTIYRVTETGQKFLMRLRAKHNTPAERRCILPTDN